MFSNRTLYTNQAQRTIFIAIPNMGTVATSLALRMVRWSRDPRFKVQFYAPSFIRPIPAARNAIVENFLRSGFEYLLMIDSDVVPPENILDLALLNLDIVAAPCPVFKDGFVILLVLREAGDEPGFKVFEEIPVGRLLEVDATGTGCMMIHRRVFEALDKPYFKFVMDDEGNLFMGEDFDFCVRARERGFKVYVHTGYLCEHWHNVNLAQFLRRD